MTILELAAQLEEALIKREREVVESKKQLQREKEALLERQQEIADRLSEAIDKESEVKKLVAKLDKDSDLTKREVAVVSKERDINLRVMELTQWENKLFDIESRQTQDKELLAEAQQKLNTDKAEYKEKLKKEFFDTLNARV